MCSNFSHLFLTVQVVCTVMFYYGNWTTHQNKLRKRTKNCPTRRQNGENSFYFFCLFCLFGYFTVLEKIGPYTRYIWPLGGGEKLLQLLMCVWSIWQYGLWSFQTGGTKLERVLPKNQHTQRKILNFENWVNGEVSKIDVKKKCQ